MKYLIVKIYSNNDIEYGKTFDNESDAINAASEMNVLTKENGWSDKVQFMVLPCVVLPKGAQ